MPRKFSPNANLLGHIAVLAAFLAVLISVAPPACATDINFSRSIPITPSGLRHLRLAVRRSLSNFGQAVTFTAQVTSAGPVPTGRVKFLDGTLKIGSATLNAGIAKLTRSTLAVGTHPITAQYLGDPASGKSTSPVVNQVVNP